MKRLPKLAMWACLCALPAAARAEVFLLTNGGRVEGELLNPNESPRKSFIVQTPLGGQLTLAKSQVARNFKVTDAEKQYEEEVRKMPDTIDGQIAMAEWCRANNLLSKRKYHLEKVIERDPDHKAARSALGFSEHDGRWLTQAEYYKSQGYVWFKGDYRLRQQAEAMQAAENFEQEVTAWKRKLRVLRGRYEKRGDGAALAEMKAIRDPAASAAFADLLANEDAHDMKLFFVEMLGECPSSAGVSTLIRHALDDNDETVRDACLRELAKNGRQQAVAAFLKGLSSKNNVTINRCGAGLGRLGDDDSVPPLIDALVTQHKTISSSGGGGGLGQIAPTFGGNGSSGLSAGSKPTVTIHEIRNDSVLSALRAITTEDFQFDKSAWRHWYADSRTPKNVNLRRRD